MRGSARSDEDIIPSGQPSSAGGLRDGRTPSLGLWLTLYALSGFCALSLEIGLTMAGGSIDDRSGVDLSCSDIAAPTTRCDAEDQAKFQESYTMSLGLDF